MLFWLKFNTKQTGKYSYLFCGFFLFILNGCFYFIDPVRKANKALKNGDCVQARKIFFSSSRKTLDFAEKAASFCLSKSPQSAVWFYHYLSEKKEEKQAFLWKEKTADIYFEILRDYEKAIEIYSVLKDQEISNKKKDFYVYRMAFCFFELGKFSAALSLLNKTVPSFLENSSHSSKMYWDNQFLIGRTLLMQNKYREAKRIFQEIQYNNPSYFKEKELFYYLSLTYELQKEFHQAISELEQFKNTSHFLNSKISRLKVRKKNQPGFPGYMKKPNK